MKIEKIESLLLGPAYVVRITTDSGLTGIGQTACWGYPKAVESIVGDFQSYLVGQDPLRIEHHWQYLYRMLPFRGNAVSGAVSAVDIALWDLKGKHYGAPVWDLLGGKCRDKVRLHLLIDGDSPEALADSVTQARDQGFTAVKFDPLTSGYADWTQDKLIRTTQEMCGAARDAGGSDVDLIVEVHRKLTPMTSLALAEALIPYNLLFLEDPIQIDSIEAQASIAKRTTVPIGNGERLNSIWEFRELLQSGGPQYVRPDVGLAGGLTHCKKIAAIAESFHCAVVTHNFLGPLITMASVHLDVSIPNVVTQEYTLEDETGQHAVYKVATSRQGGYMPAPEAPGLGVELDDSKINDLPYRPLREGAPPMRDDGSPAYSV
jgi:galactonate dehydratase